MGSCAANGNLNFNWLLILAPPEVLDYVVVHELCHRREMNHSQAFWKEVEKILPDYRERQKWLKDNGWRLMEEGVLMRKKRKKTGSVCLLSIVFLCAFCVPVADCVQASQITGKKHTACKQQWEKTYSLEVSAPMVLSWYPEYVNQSAFTFMKKTGR